MADCHVFCNAHLNIYSSPNVSNIPPEIPTYIEGRPLFKRTEDECSVQWYNPARPYLAFMPCNPNFRSFLFSGPLFGRLNYGWHDMPVSRRQNGNWTMDEEMIKSWMRLEISLSGVMALLCHKAKVNCKIWGFWIVDFLPKDAGYRNEHKTEGAARWSAVQSRNKFVIYCAYLAFLIVLNSEPDELLADACPAWMTYVQKEKPVYTLDWLNDLRQSFVGNFSFGFRVGAIFNPYRDQDAYHIKFWVSAELPVWFGWGKMNPNPSAMRELTPYTPSSQEIEWARTAASGIHSLETGCLPEERFLPPVFTYSGQTPGETYDDFMLKLNAVEQEELRRFPKDEYRAAIERLKRPRNRFFEGSYVFEWVRIGNFSLRKPIAEVDAEEVWKRYSPTQRKYHAVVDEWDLSVHLDPTAALTRPPRFFPIASRVQQVSASFLPFDTPALDNDVECNSDGYSSDSEYSSVNVVGSPKNNVEEMESLVRDETQPAPTLGPMEIDPVTAVVEPFATILSTRFGFHPIPSLMVIADHLTYSRIIQENAQIPWTRILHRFSKVPSQVDPNLESPLRRLHDYLQLNVEEPKIRLLEWDLSPEHPSPFTFGNATHFEHAVVHFPERIYLLGLHNQGPLLKQWWVFAFNDPATLLQVYRSQWSNTMAGTARALLQRGIPFRTVRCISMGKFSQRPSPTLYSSTSLGVLPRLHKFTLEDYRKYERERDKIFASPSGRAALMAGGMTWRLAQGIVLERLVIKGPSKDVRRIGAVYGTPDVLSILVDDGLHVTAEDIIHGTYFVQTGLGSQTSKVSWWPPRDVFENSGYWLGYWSDRCEEWFQRHLLSIKSNKFQPKTKSQWKGIMKSERATIQKLRSANSNLAKNYIRDGYVSFAF